MRIIVVGCGKVGETLATQLSQEGHEITVVDQRLEKVESASSSLDIMGIVGNGTSYRVMQEAGSSKADLLIAVTSTDETSLLSCMIGKKDGKCQTIARVRQAEYLEEIEFIREQIGLSMAVSPEMEAASETAKLIQIPSAMEVDTFAKGRINLIKVRIPDGSAFDGMRIADLPKVVNTRMLICILHRGKETLIPNGNTVLQANDLISILVPIWDVSKVFQKIGIKTKPIKDVIIAGGGKISYYLARILLKGRIDVKIIEVDRKRCEELSELLPDAMIVNGDATDRQLLLELGIRSCDAFVSLTDVDEENILISLYANKVSQAKLITKINRISFEEVIEEMPLGSVICPKNITAERIIRYVRTMQNSYGSNVETLYRMADNQVEALEFIVKKSDKTEALLGKPLMELSIRNDVLLCCIMRKGKIIIPSGKDTIEANDHVVLVTTYLGLKDLSDILK